MFQSRRHELLCFVVSSRIFQLLSESQHSDNIICVPWSEGQSIENFKSNESFNLPVGTPGNVQIRVIGGVLLLKRINFTQGSGLVLGWIAIVWLSGRRRN